MTSPTLFRSAIIRTSVKRIYTRLSTIAIRVVAAEESSSLVTIGDLGEPTERLTSGLVAKVLLVDGGRVAPAENVVACLSADGHGLVQALADVGLLGGIAGGMNGVLIDRSSVPSSAGSSGCGDSDSGCALLAREERVSNSSRSPKEHERRVGNHDDFGLIELTLQFTI